MARASVWHVAALGFALSTVSTPGGAEVGLSAGCSAGAPGGPPPSSLHVAGQDRGLIAIVPEEYRAGQPHQLIVAFHGRTSTNETVRRYYDLERHATRPTIFVYPSGMPTEDGGFNWSDPGDPGDALRDYALFDAIVETFGERYCIDLDRVFAVGHSLGASFVNSLGCARGDVLRAVATVAGGISLSECRGPTAAAILHNPNDSLVAFEFGERVRDVYLVENHIDETATDALEGPRALIREGDLVCRHYSGGDHPVLWCPHTRDETRRGRYYPHQWPHGTGALIMSFFESLPAPDGIGTQARAQARPGAG